MTHYCYRCGKWRLLDQLKLCADCTRAWYTDALRKGVR